jgi:hypothetical protein
MFSLGLAWLFCGWLGTDTNAKPHVTARSYHAFQERTEKIALQSEGRQFEANYHFPNKRKGTRCVIGRSSILEAKVQHVYCNCDAASSTSLPRT